MMSLSAQAKVRLPMDLAELVRLSAEKNCRSINGEIIYRLRQAYNQEEKS